MGPNYEACRTPGQLLKELLEDRGWSQRVLALIVGMGETGINKIISDRQAVSASQAIAFSEVFGIPAETFLDLQKSYDLAKARISARPDPGRATRAHLFGGLPVSEMIARRWLAVDDLRNVSKVEAELARFFGVSSPNEIEILPHAAKKTSLTEAATPPQLAWLYRVKQIAEDMLVGRFTTGAVDSAIKKLSSLLSAPEEARKAPRVMTESGIRFVLVESLAAAKIDGVCFWLDEQSPVIGLSMRHDRIDNFWFVLRHELEHVRRRHGMVAVALDCELEGDNAGNGTGIPEEERIANEAAANFCVPQNQLQRFIARKSPFFAERDILGFSRTIGIHPGLVAGQLQHKTGRYDLFRKHLVRIRSCVAPSAIVDGWGDVAPVGM